MLTLHEKIQADVVTAMKAKDSKRLLTLRSIISDLKKYAIDNRVAGSDATTADDAGAMQVLKKLDKQRRDSVEQFTKGGRLDLVAQEQFELEIIQSYLPQAMSANEIDSLVSQAIAEVGATSPRDMGKVMALVKEKSQGRADGKLVSELVKTKLS